MTQRDWIEKDFYRELGVDSHATADEIKKAYRKLARQLHPDANPGDTKAEARFKTVSEAYGVLSDDAKRKEYDETRRCSRAAAFGGGEVSPAASATGGGGRRGSIWTIFDGGAGSRRAAGGLGDMFGGLFNRAGGAGESAAARSPARPRRGDRGQARTSGTRCAAPRCSCVAARPLHRAAAPAPGRAARPRVCPTCNGVGLVSRNQGAFAFSEPCPDCRGTGR